MGDTYCLLFLEDYDKLTANCSYRIMGGILPILFCFSYGASTRCTVVISPQIQVAHTVRILVTKLLLETNVLNLHV